MTTVLGNGIYTLPEAARLIGVSRERVGAWFRGWSGGSGALLKLSDYDGLFQDLTLSFLDFVDAAVAATLRERHGASPATVRKIRNKLSKQWNTPHPFGRQDLFTDESGREVFALVADEEGEEHLIEVFKDQEAMPTVLLPFLRRVEYNGETKLAQVFPLTELVVLDPRRKYGKPIIRGTGVPTLILNECYKATRSINQTADWYSVTPEDVQAAVEFESKFSGIAA